MVSDKTIELIVPVFNEERNLERFYAEIAAVLETRLPQLRWRVLFVDDGSVDGSWPMLTDLARKHDNVRALRLNRNYGAHVAIASGMNCTEADAAVIIAADLQDPPATIEEFVRRWDEGHRVVWGVRAARHEAIHRRVFSRVFHLLVRRYALPTYP